jgi:hypothetical protein
MNKQVNKQSKQANLWKDNVSSEIERYSRLSFIQQAYGFTKHVRVVIIQPFSQYNGGRNLSHKKFETKDSIQ